MNLHSSRSHAIFIVAVECSETRPDGKSTITVGKLNLVDLAGSERQSKTGSVVSMLYSTRLAWYGREQNNETWHWKLKFHVFNKF